MELPLKFSNLLRRILISPGEEVWAQIFRPALWTTHFKYFRRMQASNLAIARSNYHWLVIQEELGNIGPKYGTIIRIIPNGSVREIEFQRNETEVNIKIFLQIGISEDQLGFSFPLEAEALLKEFIQ